MKILHQGPASQAPESLLPEAAPKDQQPGSQTLSNDARSLHAMLEAIRRFRAGELPLQVLVGELEFHLQALIMSEHDWQQSFFERWRELDRFHSHQVSRGTDQVPPKALEKINSTLEALRQLIHDLLKRTEQG